MVGFFFFLLGGIAVLAAMGVILHKNPVYSAVLLVITFLCLAGLYVLLDAPFVAAIQVIIYAGAIVVLFIFVIMLLNLRQEVRLPLGRPYQALFGALFAAFLLGQGIYLAVIGRVSGRKGPLSPEKLAEIGNTEALGGLLFSRYLFPFELASVLLVVAIVGAVLLGRKKLPRE